jgi:NAD(P)-dependent dehydrogenase (short-subunit alcohol dehydrogenase family)
MSKLWSLDESVVVVTGAGGILGSRICKGLSEFGANIAVVDIDLEVSESVAMELNKVSASKAISVQCDVSDTESVSQMTSRVVDVFGGIDVLVNNAASKSDDLNAFFAPFEEYSLEEWRKVMSVNIDGMFLVAQSVGTQMVKQGRGGSIIQTSSIYGLSAPDQRIYEGSSYLGRQINTPAVYTTSKAAVIGLTNHLATYWADKGIRVNTISPGGMESGQNEEFMRNYSNRVPMNRMGTPDEIVGAVIYLASDASSYVTGQNIVIDGGLTCW